MATQTHDGIDALHENQQRAASQGTGHVSGCAVTLTSNSSEITLDVASGSIRIEDTGVSVGADTVRLERGDGQFPRKDVIVANSNGGIEVYQGSPSRPTSATLATHNAAVRRTAQPAPDDLAANNDYQDHVVLAIVWVPKQATASTDLSSSDVWERTVPPVKAGTGQIVRESESATGDGSTMQFTLSHTFGETPIAADVQPTTPAASTDFWIVDGSLTSTDVTIEYAAAPKDGENLGWSIMTAGEAAARDYAPHEKALSSSLRVESGEHYIFWVDPNETQTAVPTGIDFIVRSGATVAVKEV